MKRGRNMDRGDPVLPEDLMTEILSRVELKVLMRLRCVSKAWNSLVLDPIFVKLHLKRSSNSPHTLLFSNVPHLWIGFFSTHSVLENPTSTINDHSRFFIHHQCFFGSCNGLVCLHDYSVHGTFEKHWVLFWNPATRIFSQPSPHLCLPSTDYNTCVFFGLGFGYDDWSNTYKAVVILLNMKTRQMELKVHSMGDTCWTNILTCPAFSITKKVGQFVSGTLNWIALVHHMEEFVIFSYDLKNETCRYSSMPVGLSEAPSCSAPHLGVLKGCLSVSVNKRTDYVVWLMREFGVETSWTKLLNVSYQHLQIYCLFPNVRTLCMSEDEDVMLLASDYSAQFIFYNKRDNRVDHIQGSNIGCYKFFSHDYVQSLVLPY